MLAERAYSMGADARAALRHAGGRRRWRSSAPRPRARSPRCWPRPGSCCTPRPTAEVVAPGPAGARRRDARGRPHRHAAAARGPGDPGLPADADGFLVTDAHARVQGVAGRLRRRRRDRVPDQAGRDRLPAGRRGRRRHRRARRRAGRAGAVHDRAARHAADRALGALPAPRRRRTPTSPARAVVAADQDRRPRARGLPRRARRGGRPSGRRPRGRRSTSPAPAASKSSACDDRGGRRRRRRRGARVRARAARARRRPHRHHARGAGARLRAAPAAGRGAARARRRRSRLPLRELAADIGFRLVPATRRRRRPDAPPRDPAQRRRAALRHARARARRAHRCPRSTTRCTSATPTARAGSRTLHDEIRHGAVRSVAFVAPATTGWLLPLYEAALLDRQRRPRRRGVAGHAGGAPARAVRARGERRRRAGAARGRRRAARRRAPSPTGSSRCRCCADRGSAGVPTTGLYGLIAIDAHGRVARHCPTSTPIGDATDFPVKQAASPASRPTPRPRDIAARTARTSRPRRSGRVARDAADRAAASRCCSTAARARTSFRVTTSDRISRSTHVPRDGG